MCIPDGLGYELAMQPIYRFNDQGELGRGEIEISPVVVYYI